MGFALNHYDRCIANCEIQGSQCTVVWYVDDNKISHAKPKVVTEVVEMIEAKFGKMTVSQGKTHNFLGMEITLNDDQTASIHMPTYIDKAINNFGEEIGPAVGTPGMRELFEEYAQAQPLDRHKRERFHSIVAKLLYIAHRGQPDLQPTIPYLCMRVDKSTMQDWEKLWRLLEYLKGTRELKLTLGSENFSSLQTWVDASYAVHSDMKSHTGEAMSLGRGTFGCKSSKQKLNTKSSTEAELVGISNYLPSTIWTRMFLEAQGHQLKRNTLAQDNQSTLQLAWNGRASAGQKSRHIDIRYFFVNDRLGIEGLTIEHCPMLAMIADFFTKPLQGALFRKLRAVILGHVPASSLLTSNATMPEERVGKQSMSAELAESVKSGELTESDGRTLDEAPRKLESIGGAIGGKTPKRARTYADVVKRVRFAPTHSLDLIPS